MKNILVTGGFGLLASTLINMLSKKKFNVISIDKKKNFYRYKNNKPKHYKLVLGDFRNKKFIYNIIKKYKIDVVFHLGATTQVLSSLAKPYDTYRNNIMGTINILENIREINPKIIMIYASSDKAYGSYAKSEMPYKEEYPLKPQYPYDTSKACADLIARSYASDIYQLPIAITRFANIYGPGQLNFSALFPDCIRSALGYSKFIPRGDGSHIRDFLFIDDVISLYSLISSKLIHESKSITGQVFNAGTNEPRAVKDIINIIYNKIGNIDDLSQVNMQLNNNTTIGEIDCQYMDYDKVNSFFNWKPETPFDLGIDKTIKWYDSYLKKIYNK